MSMDVSLAMASEGRCLTCHTWATIRSKINARSLGVVRLVRHEDSAGRWCTGDQARELRGSVVIGPPLVSRAAVQAAISNEELRASIDRMAAALMAGVTQDHEGKCGLCGAWVALEDKAGPVDGFAPWVIVEHSIGGTSKHKCAGRLTNNTRSTHGPSTMAATPIKEDKSVDAQTIELRLRLRNARAERELKLKTDNADAIVTRLDSLPAGAIVRFVKPYEANGGKPAGEYTYVAIKPVDGARWYTTGCDANPMTSDDLASFMVGGQSVTSWDVLGDAAETFQVPDVTATDTADAAKTDA